jgi:hypothetical protein
MIMSQFVLPRHTQRLCFGSLLARYSSSTVGEGYYKGKAAGIYAVSRKALLGHKVGSPHHFFKAAGEGGNVLATISAEVVMAKALSGTSRHLPGAIPAS